MGICLCPVMHGFPLRENDEGGTSVILVQRGSIFGKVHHAAGQSLRVTREKHLDFPSSSRSGDPFSGRCTSLQDSRCE